MVVLLPYNSGAQKCGMHLVLSEGIRKHIQHFLQFSWIKVTTQNFSGCILDCLQSFENSPKKSTFNYCLTFYICRCNDTFRWFLCKYFVVSTIHQLLISKKVVCIIDGQEKFEFYFLKSNTLKQSTSTFASTWCFNTNHSDIIENRPFTVYF